MDKVKEGSTILFEEGEKINVKRKIETPPVCKTQIAVMKGLIGLFKENKKEKLFELSEEKKIEESELIEKKKKEEFNELANKLIDEIKVANGDLQLNHDLKDAANNYLYDIFHLINTMNLNVKQDHLMKWFNNLVEDFNNRIDAIKKEYRKDAFIAIVLSELYCTKNVIEKIKICFDLEKKQDLKFWFDFRSLRYHFVENENAEAANNILYYMNLLEHEMNFIINARENPAVSDSTKGLEKLHTKDIVDISNKLLINWFKYRPATEISKMLYNFENFKTQYIKKYGEDRFNKYYANVIEEICKGCSLDEDKNDDENENSTIVLSFETLLDDGKKPKGNQDRNKNKNQETEEEKEETEEEKEETEEEKKRRKKMIDFFIQPSLSGEHKQTIDDYLHRLKKLEKKERIDLYSNLDSNLILNLYVNITDRELRIELCSILRISVIEFLYNKLDHEKKIEFVGVLNKYYRMQLYGRLTNIVGKDYFNLLISAIRSAGIPFNEENDFEMQIDPKIIYFGAILEKVRSSLYLKKHEEALLKTKRDIFKNISKLNFDDKQEALKPQINNLQVKELVKNMTKEEFDLHILNPNEELIEKLIYNVENEKGNVVGKISSFRNSFLFLRNKLARLNKDQNIGLTNDLFSLSIKHLLAYTEKSAENENAIEKTDSAFMALFNIELLYFSKLLDSCTKYLNMKKRGENEFTLKHWLKMRCFKCNESRTENIELKNKMKKNIEKLDKLMEEEEKLENQAEETEEEKKKKAEKEIEKKNKVLKLVKNLITNWCEYRPGEGIMKAVEEIDKYNNNLLSLSTEKKAEEEKEYMKGLGDCFGTLKKKQKSKESNESNESELDESKESELDESKKSELDESKKSELDESKKSESDFKNFFFGNESLLALDVSNNFMKMFPIPKRYNKEFSKKYADIINTFFFSSTIYYGSSSTKSKMPDENIAESFRTRIKQLQEDISDISKKKAEINRIIETNENSEKEDLTQNEGETNAIEKLKNDLTALQKKLKRAERKLETINIKINAEKTTQHDDTQITGDTEIEEKSDEDEEK